MADEKISTENIVTEQSIIESKFLERDVIIDCYLPRGVKQPEAMSLLLINDGQDLPKMPFDEILDGLISSGEISPLLCIGIHCGPERKMEYGTANEKDYKGRGAKAGLYTQFIFEENKFAIPLLGTFNIYNALPAILLGKHLSIDGNCIVEGVKNCNLIPGRMEIIDEGQFEGR